MGWSTTSGTCGTEACTGAVALTGLRKGVASWTQGVALGWSLSALRAEEEARVVPVGPLG